MEVKQLAEINAPPSSINSRHGLIRAPLYDDRKLGNTTLIPMANVIFMYEEQEAYFVTDGVTMEGVAAATNRFGD